MSEQPQEPKKPGKGKKIMNGIGKGVKAAGRIVEVVSPTLGKVIEQGGEEIKSATDGDPNT